MRKAADLYPLDVLSKEPDGEETFVTSPDGTRLRAIVKGSGLTVILAHGYRVSLAA